MPFKRARSPTVLLSLILLSLCFYAFLFNEYTDEQNKPSKYIRPLQEVDFADIVPQKENSATQMFFLETSHPEGGSLRLAPRDACAIESAAQLHPNYNIFVFFVGDIFFDSRENCTKIVNNLLENNKNVIFRKLDVQKFSVGTPMEEFFKGNSYKESKNYLNHLSDLLRFTALWKYGGLYFDLDVVVVKNVDDLGENFVVAATKKSLMSGTLRVSSEGVGHRFVERCVNYLAKHYRANSFTGNGPDVVTGATRNFCGTKNISEMTEEKCQGMKVLDKILFLPIWYTGHKLFFYKRYAKKLADFVENNSYTAHIFSRMNRHMRLEKGAEAAYFILAEKYCPVVYNTLEIGETF